MIDTEQLPIALIVEIDVEGMRVRVQCPYHNGVGGHSHWVNLGGAGLAEEYRIPACVRGKYYRVSLSSRVVCDETAKKGADQ